MRFELREISRAGHNVVSELFIDGIRTGTLHTTPEEFIELKRRLQ